MVLDGSASPQPLRFIANFSLTPSGSAFLSRVVTEVLPLWSIVHNPTRHHPLVNGRYRSQHRGFRRLPITETGMPRLHLPDPYITRRQDAIEFLSFYLLYGR